MVLVATQVKRRRGTTAENDAFTGAEGEIVVDTERHELRVHDGVTQGGFKIGGGSSLVIGQILEVVSTADYTPEGCLLADGAEYTKAQFPDLWANFLTGTPKLQTCTYTEYANQIAEYGFCNKFAVDTTNETFKVPTRNKYRKLVKKIVNGTSWANIYDDGWVEQGGRQTGATSGSVSVLLLVTMADTDYSVQVTSTDQSLYGTGSPNTTTQITVETRGHDHTVQPCRCVWRVSGYTTIPDSTANITREFVVVANGTLNQEQMDWSAWASSLAGKTNIVLDNLSSEGKSRVANLAMPSDVFDDLTLGATGSRYTAPANGYFTLAKWASSGQIVVIESVSNGCRSFACTSISECPSATLPVKKGDSVAIYYSASGNVLYFRFVYAKGEQNV